MAAMTAKSESLFNFADWQAKVPDLSAADMFSRPDWFKALYQHCRAEFPLVIYYNSDELASASLVLTTEPGGPGLESLSNWYSFHWQPILTGPAERAEALLVQLLRDAQLNVFRLKLGPIQTANGQAEQMERALKAAGWTVESRNSSHKHWLDTQGRSFADWWAQRPGALRSTVKRKGNKGLVQLKVTSQFSDSDWDDFEAIYRDSWKPPESHPQFLRERARAEGENGTLLLGLAHIGDEAVAAQYWSVDIGTAYIHKLAHRTGHDNLSPGTLLTHALFAHVFDVAKVDRIDFGTGDDGYKRDWMEASAPLVTIEAWDRSQLASWFAMGSRMFSRLARRLRGG